MREIGEGYKITIQCGATSITPAVFVESFVPEEIQLGYQAEFDQPFQQIGRLVASAVGGLAGYNSGGNAATRLIGAAVGAGLPHLMASALGSGMTAPVLTAKLWQSTSTAEITIPLYFEAESDPLLEVRKPIVDLLSLVIPTTNALGILQSPSSYVDFSKVATGVKVGIKTASAAAGQYAESKWGSLLSGMSDIASNVQNGTINVGGAVDKVKESATNTANSFSMTDVTEGLQSATDAVVNTVKSAASKGAEFSRAVTSANALKPYLNKIISVRIGTYLEFPCVVIHSVVPTFTSQIDYMTGWPMAARVDVTFSSMFSSTQKDMQEIFSSIPQRMVANSAQGFAYNSLTGAIGGKVAGLVGSATSGLIGDAGSIVKNKVNGVASGIAKEAKSFIDDLF